MLLPLLIALSAAVPASARAAAAGADSARRAFIATMAELVEREPRHVGALYVAARTASRIGDEAETLRWLDRLEHVGSGDRLEPADFGAIARTRAFRQRAARFAAAAPRVGRVERSLELMGGDLLPEGTAWDPRRGEVLISSGRQRTVYAFDTTGRGRPVAPSGDGGMLAVLGMQVDPGTDALWVATTAAPFMVPNRPEEAGTAVLARIDLARGRVTASYPAPGGGFLNDLALLPDGAVVVTDSDAGLLYRLAPGADSLVALVPRGTFESPNGIVALAGGDLVVADFHGLWRVRARADGPPAVERLSAPDSSYLGGFDGLSRSGDRVVGIQNLAGLGRVWELRIDVERATVTPTLLLRGHPDLMNPTTGVLVGDRYHFVPDPRLQESLPDGTLSPLPRGRRGHRLLTLRLPAR